MKKILSHTTIFLSQQNLIDNYNYLSSYNSSIKVAPVLKSNAYGHGIIQIAKILDNLKAPFFCVNSFEEAYFLLKNNIKTPILIMGSVDPNNLKDEEFPFSYTLYSEDQQILKILNKSQKGTGIHIFVDTGMGREGIHIENLTNFLTTLKKYPKIKVEGLMSHLASGDKPNKKITQKQLSNFKKAKNILKELNIYPKWFHIAASSAFLNIPKIKLSSINNLSRIGKALYGLDPKISDINLKPVLTLSTKIIQIKNLKKGDTVGYDCTFKANDIVTLGILPLGYYDGIDRRLSNKGFIYIENNPCPIVGKVSMNLTTVDISSVKNPYVGQKALIYSNNIKNLNSVENSAFLCKTIPYDIVTHLPTTLKRKIV